MFVEPQDSVDEKRKDANLPEEVVRNDPNRNALPPIDPEAMEGEKYNMCHFWSNFEIARLSWFRSKEYNDFFQMMDRSGGFWMERVSRRPSGQQREERELTSLAVGRCAHSLSRRRRSAGSTRHPLLPRLWLPAHDHPALPRQRAGPSAPAPAVPGDDDARREEANRRGPILGELGRGQGERRRLPLQMRHGHCRRGGKRRVVPGRVGRRCRRLGESLTSEERSRRASLGPAPSTLTKHRQAVVSASTRRREKHPGGPQATCRIPGACVAPADEEPTEHGRSRLAENDAEEITDLYAATLTEGKGNGVLLFFSPSEKVSGMYASALTAHRI